ncbi:hypothetical protein D3C85_1090250 [compost metagenome]
MALLDSRTTRLGDVLQYEDHPEYGYCRKVITVTEAAPVVYQIGRVIGDDLDTFQDTDEFVGIYVGSPTGDNKQSIAAATPTEVVVLFRGPAGVGKANLVFGSTVNDAPKLAAALAKIEAAGIQLIEQPEQFA